MTPAPVASADAPAAAVRYEGRTTDGKTLRIPDVAAGRPLVVVVGMSEKAGAPTATLTEALQRDDGARVRVVGVALLDRVPRLFRGFVERAIDGKIGPPIAGRAGFCTTFDGDALRRAAPSGDEDVPVVYVYRADGSVASVTRTASEAEAGRLTAAVATP